MDKRLTEPVDGGRCKEFDQNVSELNQRGTRSRMGRVGVAQKLKDGK